MSQDYCEICNKHPVYKTNGKGQQVCRSCAYGGVPLILNLKQDRNAPCDCGSGKKFKKCCYQLILAGRGK